MATDRARLTVGTVECNGLLVADGTGKKEAINIIARPNGTRDLAADARHRRRVTTPCP